MTNVEKLKQLGGLGAIRQRLGADGEKDTDFDEQINGMSHSQLVKEWCGWHIGDGSWWTEMKNLFDNLEKLDKNKTG